MAEFELGCDEIVVITPPPPKVIVEAPAAPTVTVEAPHVDVTVRNPVVPSITVEPLSSREIVVPLKGPKGDPGLPGGGSGGGAPRYTYIDPVQSPNGVRTVFTVPSPYVLGSLAVYLNGLQEFHISELTATTFSFETAPYSTDTIKVEFDALI